MMGCVQMVNFVLFMNRQLGTSKGCGFAFFKEKKDAEAAIEGLHDKRTLPVMPLTHALERAHLVLDHG